MIESVTPGLLANTSLLEETIWIFPSHFQVPSATHVLGYGTSLACYCCIESATAKDYVPYLIYAVEMLCYPLENNISTQISNDNDRWSNIWSHVKYIASRKNQSDFLNSVILNPACSSLSWTWLLTWLTGTTTPFLWEQEFDNGRCCPTKWQGNWNWAITSGIIFSLTKCYSLVFE